MHAFAASAAPGAKIYRLDDGPTNVAAMYKVVSGVVGDPVELAVDPDHVYWIDKTTMSSGISKSVYVPTPGAAPFAVATGYTQISGLVVDQRIGGCVYFWGNNAQNVPALRVAPKGP